MATTTPKGLGLIGEQPGAAPETINNATFTDRQNNESVSTQAEFEAILDKTCEHGITLERLAILALLRSKIKTSNFGRLTEADLVKNETLQELVKEIEARGK